ncbi:MAG: hypothetical protein R3B49_01300 [Phycisphaerales bacterium]
MASLMVSGAFLALTPVVNPWCGAPSMETVKGVARTEVLTADCSCSSRRAQSASVSERHMYPRATESMKVMASGVTNWAGRTRSPSFSRASSSVRMIMRPARSSSRTSGTGEKGASGMGGGW